MTVLQELARQRKSMCNINPWTDVNMNYLQVWDRSINVRLLQKLGRMFSSRCTNSVPCPASMSRFPRRHVPLQGPRDRAFLGTSSTELSLTAAVFTSHNISESSVSFIWVFRIRTSAMEFEILSRRIIYFLLPSFHS